MEVIPFGCPSTKPPLLFIHGSYCGAWIWNRYFLPAFCKAGWSGAAISLRGHGQSEGIERISRYGIADYLEDIDAGVKLFDGNLPILVGHSLGGYLAQKYALEKPVKGQVLLASPSLLGLQGSMQHIATHRPMLALQLSALMTLGPQYADMNVILSALFGDQKCAEKLKSKLPPLQRESSRILLEGSFPDFRLPMKQVPTLALGGDADAFVPEFEFRYEATFWHGQSKILHGVPHGLMLDSCWPDVAREIMGWLMAQEP